MMHTLSENFEKVPTDDLQASIVLIKLDIYIDRIAEIVSLFN